MNFALVLHYFLAAIHAAAALSCLIAIPIAKTDSVAPAFIGLLLYGGMTVTILTRSRWVILPGGLLLLAILLLAAMFGMAVLWPASTVNRLLVFCAALFLFEVVAIVSTLYQRNSASRSQVPETR